MAQTLAVYLQRRVLIVMFLGFSSGLPLALSGSTLAIWMRESGVNLGTIGLFALIGTPYSLDSITAAVLGGTSLVGGVISGVGALVAGVLLTLINTLLNLRGMSPFLQWIVKGAILIAALSLDFLRRRARRT